MKIHFYKYQATGNDFVLIDNRQANLELTKGQIESICHRRFGVGADGVILLSQDEKAHFRMTYFNPDGSQSLCGNGCRSAVDLASRLKLINGTAHFSAFDGLHQATLLKDGQVRLQMNNVKGVQRFGDDFFIHTGSPHYIRVVPDISVIDVVKAGRELRHKPDFAPGGTNVNFMSLMPDNTISVRTYERGVEDETLSCGTGVTAAALAASVLGYLPPVRIKVAGGTLEVDFKSNGPDTFTDIFLTGPAKMVYEGDLDL